jgi:hypothetical protein
MMVIYVPPYGVWRGGPFVRTPFDGCFCYLSQSGSRCSWVVPGTWPEWML